MTLIEFLLKEENEDCLLAVLSEDFGEDIYTYQIINTKIMNFISESGIKPRDYDKQLSHLRNSLMGEGSWT